MYSHTDNSIVQTRLRTQIHESERAINYLNERLKSLELKARPQTTRTDGGGRYSGGGPPLPPKDRRENGAEFGKGWQQPGPGIPNKSRQYTKLGTNPQRRGDAPGGGCVDKALTLVF